MCLSVRLMLGTIVHHKYNDKTFSAVIWHIYLTADQIITIDGTKISSHSELLDESCRCNVKSHHSRVIMIHQSGLIQWLTIQCDQYKVKKSVHMIILKFKGHESVSLFRSITYLSVCFSCLLRHNDTSVSVFLFVCFFTLVCGCVSYMRSGG